VSVDAVAEEAAELSEGMFADTPTRFSFEPGSDGARVVVDPEGLRQALQAMIIASARCTTRGRVALSTGLSGDAIYARVTDTGIPWPGGDGDLDEAAYARSAACGSGIGAGTALSVARKLAELSGASFRAWRPEAGGAAFEIVMRISGERPS
jgi:signal transduction histidine kinase